MLKQQKLGEEFAARILTLGRHGGQGLLRREVLISLRSALSDSMVFLPNKPTEGCLHALSDNT